MNGAESTRDSNIRNEIMSQVLRIVEEQFEVPADDPIHVPAVVIVSALFAGPDVDAITRLTGCSRESVEAIASRMQASKIWCPDTVDYDWFCRDPQLGYVNFLLDLGVAEGRFFRTTEKRNGRWLFSVVEHPELRD